MIALALLLLAAPDATASVIEVSGDVVVSISADARATSTTGEVDVRQDGATFVVAAKRTANATVGFGAPKLEKLIVRDGARVTIDGFAGKSLAIVAAGDVVVVVTGKGASKLVIDGAGTARIDTRGLAVDDVDVTLVDAARATVKATRSLRCDLKRASRLVVMGKPANVVKKLAGVAKLDLK